MSSLTRTSVTGIDAVVEHGSSLGDGPLIWNVDWGNSFAGNNSVTFDPYRIVGWRKLIRDGASATSNLNGVHWTASRSRFTFSWIQRVYFPEVNEWHFANTGVRGDVLAYAEMPNNTSSSLSRANNAALSAFAAKCYKAQHDFQSGVALGELSKTIAMIRNPAKSLFQGVGRYLSRARTLGGSINSSTTRRSQSLRQVSDLWLEYQYGWRPLVSDIDNGAKALASIITYRLPRKTLYAVGRDSTGDDNPGPLVSNETGGIKVAYRRKQISTTSVKYSGMMQVRPASDISGSLQAVGLDFPSFLPTVWELIPYSFLVDYFSNVGNIIYACSNPSSLCSWVEKGTLIESTCHVDVESALSPGIGWGPVTLQPASAVLSKRQVSRGPYTGSLVPGLQFQLPNFGLKWLNLAALATSHASALRAFR